MNRYEFLADQFSQGLGYEYNIKYYENSQPKWENILLENMIHGNMLINGGNTIKTGGSLVDTKQLGITFLIPIDLETFSKATQTIDDYFNSQIGNMHEFEGDLIAIASYYRTDASKSTVNGTDYALVTIYCTVIFYDNAVLSYETSIKVDGKELTGILNVVYSNQHSTDGCVFGLVSPEQKNYLNSIAMSLTIDLVLRRNDEVHLDILRNVDTDKKYTIEYFNGFITRTNELMILKLDESVPTGDIIKAQVVFGRGNS